MKGLVKILLLPDIFPPLWSENCVVFVCKTYPGNLIIRDDTTKATL